MILAHRDGARVTLVRQVDHQRQCAAFARAWGNADFAVPARAASLVTAAALHDEGWRAWEHRPRTGPDGVPLDFPDIDRAEHVALYRDGIDAVCRVDPWAGHLASLHGVGLYRGRLGLDHVVPGAGERPPAVDRFLAYEDARRERLRAWLGHPAELDRWAWAGYRLLQAWDLLSLVALWHRLAGRDEVDLARVPRAEDDEAGCRLVVRRAPAADGPRTVLVAPWPFAGDRVDAPVAARTVSLAALARFGADALAGAPWERLAVVLLPG